MFFDLLRAGLLIFIIYNHKILFFFSFVFESLLDFIFRTIEELMYLRQVYKQVCVELYYYYFLKKCLILFISTIKIKKQHSLCAHVVFFSCVAIFKHCSREFA